MSHLPPVTPQPGSRPWTPTQASAQPSATRLAHLRARLQLPVTRRATGLLDGRHRSVLQGHGQDFDDLSLYTPGDDVGDIDWKSSARAGIPVIKRFVRQSNLNLVIAVDTGRTMAALSAGGQTKGHVVTEAATLIAYLARDRGDRVALVAADAGRLTQQPPRGGTAHLEVLLRQIGRSFSTDAPESDLPRLLTRVGGGFSRRALVVLLTDETNPAPEHADALKGICTRHEVLVVSVADADPLDASGGAARDVGDGWAVPAWLQGRRDLQAAAAAARAERAASRAAMLRRMQVHDAVVHHSDDVVPALVDLLTRSRRARR
ncbi:MAG: hypothetical protein JWP95_1810 [Actinotalea sp.]|nr:hypothetical protein [Actinotalea sp.]